MLCLSLFLFQTLQFLLRLNPALTDGIAGVIDVEKKIINHQIIFCDSCQFFSGDKLETRGKLEVFLRCILPSQQYMNNFSKFEFTGVHSILGIFVLRLKIWQITE